MKITLMVLLLMIGLLTRTGAAPHSLVVILLPGTSLREWQQADAPNLHRLLQTGALAVMNTRTAHQAGQKGRETPQSVLLTLGAGSRAAGEPGAGGLSESDGFVAASARVPGALITNSALFKRRTGEAPGMDLWVCPDWPAVLKAGSSTGYDLRIGGLTDTLKAHGINVAAGGGCAADWVSAGNDGTVRHLPKLQPAPGLCLFWDAGSNVAAADALIGQVAGKVAAIRGHLIILAAYPSDLSYQRDDRLTPVLLWGQGIPSGLLHSPSTRRSGLVTDTDFAPSVAKEFDLSRKDFRTLPFGFSWYPEAGIETEHTLINLANGTARQVQGMRLLPYMAAFCGCWMVLCTLMALERKIPPFCTFVPLFALTASLLAVSSFSFWVILLSFSPLALVMTRSVAAALLPIWLSVIVLVLVLDMSTGNLLMQQSLLGYSALEGARYYGIGNEAMGLLLASALLAAARLWSAGKNQRTIFVGAMACIVLLLGSAGAKAGGVLVSTAVFGAFLFSVSGRLWSWRIGALLSIMAIGGIVLVALADAFLFPKMHSHIGEAVRRIASGGAGEALDIIHRKLAIDGRLAYHSAWAVPLWAGIVCTVIRWKQVVTNDPADSALRLAGIVGMIACLVLNDAGVVAAGIFVMLFWCEAMTQKQSLPAVKVSTAGRLAI